MPPPTSNGSCRASASALAAADAPPASHDAQPLGEPEFAALVHRYCPLPAGAPIAVAVSGGSDSMALALLAVRWARAEGRSATAVTLDHGLRPASGDEAEQVGRWLSHHDLPHAILRWSGPKPANGLQTAARSARYRLIAEWARARAISHLMVAHQCDDQAETFLMRLARGSSPAGLAAMRPLSERDGLVLVRPLLGVSRARLRATLRAAGQGWIDDPSNESLRFARTGYRYLVGEMGARGVSPARIARLADDCARFDALMEAAARRLLGAAAVRNDDGSLALDRRLLRQAPEPVLAKALRHILGEIGGQPFAPRLERLTRAHDRLVSDESPLGFTLGRCRFEADSAAVRVSREAGRAGAGSFRAAAIAL